ncbi:MAG: HAD family hydrolase [Candidatus Margulisiibacteriota bacterium]
MIKSLLILFLFANSAFASVDPLPSWKNTATKKAIVTFVTKVTNPKSSNFVPIAKRIATFDNDGTLWSEQPIYFQYYFIFDRIKANPQLYAKWQNKQPFLSMSKGDTLSALASGEHPFMEMYMSLQSGMTTDELEKTVADWIATARHPQTKRLFTEMVYQPMLELLTYLRANGFKTYIVSGAPKEFIRPWAEKIYGIPPEQVIGTSFKTMFEIRNNQPIIITMPEIALVTDKEVKPVGIQSYIGRRPIFSCGNSDGDLPMMQWTAAGNYFNFCLYIHHTDAKREYNYDRNSFIGLFDKGLDHALAKGWTIVNMKNDWKTIYVKAKK